MSQHQFKIGLTDPPGTAKPFKVTKRIRCHGCSKWLQPDETAQHVFGGPRTGDYHTECVPKYGPRVFNNYGDILAALCKVQGRWGLYLEPGDKLEDLRDKEFDEAFKLAAPWVPDDCWVQTEVMLNGRAFVLFDTKAEATAAFECTVGDDGPTETNAYDGPYKVYALLASPEKGALDENT